MPKYDLEIKSDWTLAVSSPVNGSVISLPTGVAFYWSVEADNQPGSDYENYRYHDGLEPFSITLNAGLELWLATRRQAVNTVIERPTWGDSSGADALLIAQAAQAAASLTRADLGAILSDEITSYATGTVFQTRIGGTSYEVADPTASDHHLTTAGGVKLYEAGPTFTTRRRLAQAVARGTLANGEQASVRNISYIADAAATGMNSAMWDIGLDGVRAEDRPDNAYIAGFHDHNSPRVIRLYASADGNSWRLLNALPLEHDAGQINGGNPVIAYRDGWFYIMVSFYSPGNYDFRLYKTRDFTSFEGPFNCNAGPTPISSNTNPAPGGSVPANEVWGADMTFTPEGVMHVRVSVPFGPAEADVRGRMIGNRRMYRTVCTNLNTLTFSAPILEDIPTGHAPRLYQSTTGALQAPSFPLNHQDAAPVAGRAGFEIGFAENFAAAFPLDDLIIVPAGKSGTGFADGEWAFGGAAYNEAVSRIKAVIAAHPTAVVEGVLWHQGEADRNNSNYSGQLSSLIDRLRVAVPQLSGKPFIMGEIGRWANTLSVDVNAVMATVSASKAQTAVVSSEGLTDRGDALHFNSPSYRALGKRYWEAFKTLRGSVGSGVSPVKRIIVIAGQSNSVGASPYQTPSMIDASVTRASDRWLLNLKDSTQQTIRIYNGPSITGPWSFQEEVAHPTYAVEGSSIVPRRLSSGAVAYDLYMEAHNTSDAEFIAAQQILLYRGNTSAAGWGSVTPTWLKSTRGIRHGTPLNLGFEDPAAYRAAQRFLTFADGSAVINNEQWNQLNTGSRVIIPNHGAVYYIDSGVTNLTILDGAADEFYLACLSDAPDVGITVQQRGFPNAWSMVGFGINNAEMVKYEKRPETGRYYPVGGRTQPFMEATKGGADQTVSGSATTRVSFGTELIDIGGFFSGSVWTPPAGRYRLVASVTFGGSQSGELNFVSIRKNDSPVSTVRSSYSDTDRTLIVEAYVTTQGGSTFDVAVGLGGSGSKTIRGGATVTWFVGAPI